MGSDRILEQLLEIPSNISALEQPLSDSLSEEVIMALKAEVDRHWFIDANRSVELADLIIRIGDIRSDPDQIALGLMARGDSLKILGQMRDALNDLNSAAELYMQNGNAFGWARTCIGRLYTSVVLQHDENIHQDAQLAREIFEEHRDLDKIVRLNINLAAAYMTVGNHTVALDLYCTVLEQIDELGEAGERFRSTVLNWLGAVNLELGRGNTALTYFEEARKVSEARNETTVTVTAELNIAYVYQLTGRLRESLSILHRLEDRLRDEKPLNFTIARRMIVESYLKLNRFDEALILSEAVSHEYERMNFVLYRAHTLRYMAIAQIRLGQFKEAQATLELTRGILQDLQARTWLAHVDMLSAELALQHNDHARATEVLQYPLRMFADSNEALHLAQARLLAAQIDAQQNQVDSAKREASQVLEIALSQSVPTLRFSAQMLLGSLCEVEQQLDEAIEHYWDAHLTVEKVQRELSATLRTSYFDDKTDAIHALIRLQIASGDSAEAFVTLDRMKAVILFDHLLQHDARRLVINDDRLIALAAELQSLREHHQHLYSLLYDLPLEDKNRGTRESLMDELDVLESQMRSINERLLLADNRRLEQLQLPNLAEIQASIQPDQVLLAYYANERGFYCFVVTHDRCEVVLLRITAAAVGELIGKLQFNLDCALRMPPGSPASVPLTRIGQRLLNELYKGLLEPMMETVSGYERITFVPFGVLHYLPFHLLHTGEQYLIERSEVVVLPSASLITQPPVKRNRGANVLAHSWDGRLNDVIQEAEIVHEIFGGDIHVNEQASLERFASQPGQILHISAHGEYRLDNPDLSFIELADGQIYTDDLWQHDLSYELVTLSACETGRANVTSGEELIGLGRGFLYGGAGAIIGSLWRVDDSITIDLMAHLYQKLGEGWSKSAALRDAQLALLTASPQLHPAYWGAFQQVGDPGPLSS